MTSDNAKTICSGLNVSLTLTSDIAANYTWVAADNPFVTGESTTNQNTNLIDDNLVNSSAVAQTVIYTVTPVSTPGGCTGTPQTVTITVNPVNTITLTSAAGTDSQTKCINTPITTITYSTTGATGATFSGLPAGVSGTWAANTITISGTPTVAGNYSFDVELTGGCGIVNISGSITVTPDNTVSAASSSPTICINNALSPAITHNTTGATGIGAPTGLPAGMTASFGSNTITISGTPTASGTFNYSIPLTGGCNTLFATGTIEVTPTVGTPVFTAGNTSLCQNPANETYTATATNTTGITYSVSPAAAGTINPSTGEMDWNAAFTGTASITASAAGCNGPATATRTVTVLPTVGTPTEPTLSATTICQGSGPTTYTTLATDATSYTWSVTGAGNSISGSGASATVTWDPDFSGVATVSVTANGCNGPSAAASTTVTVRPTPTVSIDGTTSVCQNSIPAPDITFTNPMALPVTITYNINGGASQTINVGANDTETVAAPTATIGNYAYNLVSVQYQSAPGCSSSVSGTATVTVRPEAPVQPGAITGSTLVLPATVGNVYSISPVANANTYTWTVPTGWTITAGQGTTSITVTSGTASQDGNITVTAGNDCGTSPATTLSVAVDANLAIITDPVSQTDCYYNTVLFSVTISGGGSPITYKWQRNTGSGWADIVGDPDITYPAAGSMLVADIGSAENPNGTQYRVVVTDAGGSAKTSNPATLTVNRVATMTGSLSTAICEGQSVTYTATTEGETPISFQWERDGVPVPGATGLTLTINNATLADAGKYRLAVVFPMTTPNNNGGNPATCSTTSSLYRDLVVNPLPVLSGPSEVCIGQTITWTADKTGTWVSNNPAVATIHATTGVVTGISAGTATFTFTENETTTTCSSTTPPVTVHPLPTGTIALSGDAEICEGESSSLEVTLTGTAPWSITYSDGNTPVTINAINSSPYIINVNPATTSTYTLTAVSDAHCNATSLTGNAKVTVHPLPTATLSGTTTICVGSPADLSLALTGTQPWSITYTDGVTPVTVSGITSSPYLIPVSPVTTTTYSLLAVSDAHCTGTSLTGTATINVDQEPTAAAGGTQTICVNGTATVSGAAASGGTILWTEDGAGSITSGATTLTPVYTPAPGDAGNTVTLTMTVTSNTTCTTAPPATANYTVIVEPLPTASAGGSQTICYNGTATISGATATNGTILWTHNGSGTLTDATTLIPTYTAGPTDAGTIVILTMTVTSNNTCAPQTATATYSVNVNPEPQVNQPANQEMCTGTSTTMVNFTTTNTVGITTYSWTNSEPSIGLAASGTGNIVPFTATNTGSQPLVATITVTPRLTYNGISCDGPSKTFTITVNPVPVAVAPIGLTYCNGILSDPFPLTGTPTGVLFDISGGAAIGLANINGVAAIPAFTPIAGTATLTIIPKVNGCTGFPVSFNVTVRPTPTATITGGATVCQNSAPPNIVISNPMNLTVTVTYNINGTGSYNVNIPAKSNVSIGVPTNSSGTFHYNLVSVQYLNSEPPTCSTPITGTATINVVPQPVPVITGPTNICAETTGHVYTTEAGMTNYNWVVSAGGTITAGGGANDNTVTVTWNAGGPQNISVLYTNTSGCVASTPTVFPVNVYPLPVPAISGSTSACVGSTNKVYTTQPGMTNYQWTVSPGGTITAGGTATSNSVTVTWTTVGPQTITVNYRNANGCTASAPNVKNITVTPLPVPTITGPTVMCAGSTGNIYTTEAGMSGYVWTVSAGGTITAGGTSNSNTATIRWNTAGPQTVSVSYTNLDGCTPSSPTVYPVTVNPRPTPTITGPTSVCVGSTGNVYTTEAGMNNYTWTIAAGGTITAGGGAGDNTVTVTWTTTGAKTVKVNYADANGCTAASPTTLNVTSNALPTPAIAPLVSNVCVGSSVTYTTVSGMSNYAWTVSAGGTITAGGTSTDHEVTVTWHTAGPQTVSLNYTNLNGCSAVNPGVRNVTVYPEPIPTFINPVLNGCTGSAGVVYTTQAGMTGYAWSVTGGTIVSGGSGTDNTATVVWNTTGVQTISVNYYNANGCIATTPATASVTIVDPTPPTCPDDKTVCSSDAFILLNEATPAGGVYSGPGVTMVAGNYRFTPATAGPGVHTITYTRNTVCAETCTFTITVNQTPVGSASAQPPICSGETTNIILNSTVPGTTFTWTVAKVSGADVTGTSDCTSDCGNVIAQQLTNTTYTTPGVYRYTITPYANGCTGTPFTVNVTVNPVLAPKNISWNSNFDQNTFEVCVGGSVLNDNDLDIIPTPANNSYNGLNPTWEYAPTPDGPWSPAPGVWSVQGNYQWTVASELMSQLGDYYFRFTLTNSYGCTSSSDIAEVHVISTLNVEAGPDNFICTSPTQTAFTLAGAYVGGYSSTAKTGTWSASPNVGTFVQNTSDPGAATYRPPNNYVGDITLTLLTNDPDGGGQCDPLTDTRVVHVLPAADFTGCQAPSTWPVTHSNSNGNVSLDCAVRITGSDNGTGTAGTTDINHCTGAGNITFNWHFSAPENLPVLHSEDLQVSYFSNSIRNFSINRPSNLSSGDMILITLHFYNNPGTITVPAGFVPIEVTTSTSATVASYYKIASGSEPASYAITTQNNSQYARIESVRVTGFNSASPIGATNSATNNGNIIVSGYRIISIPSVNIGSPNSILVANLTVNNSILYPEAPTGMETYYFNDSRTAARDAWQMYTTTGPTGNKIFKWPTYGTVNQTAYPAAAHMFVINPANNGGDAAYYLLNGTPTLLGSSNGTSGTATVAVNSGDSFGFRVGTTTNTGGPGVLTIYNLSMPNDAPVLTGEETIEVPGCQDLTYIPTFTDPTVTDDCGTPVLKTGYPIPDPVVINGCVRSQKKTWIYVDDCGEESLPFEQTVEWNILSPLIISCPIDPELPACSDATAITEAYDIWKSGFTTIGGCNVTTNILSIPPLVLTNIACGDTLTFIYTATDECGQEESCMATFTIKPLTTLDITCPADPNLPACSDQATILAAYNAWKAGFGYSGGCAAVTDNMDEFPALTDLTCGGQLEFIYAVENSCGQSNSCVSTFTVAPFTELEIIVPPSVSLPLCSDETDIQTAYDAWKAGFTTTGGCDVVTNIASFPALSDLSCGGTLSFTFTAENGPDGCSDLQEGTSTFTVADAPELTVVCPVDPVIPGCLGIQAITDAYDTWVDGFKVFGGCNVTTNIASVPTLGGLVCNGQLTFTFRAQSGTGVCADYAECTATFTIGAASPLAVIVPADLTMEGCNTDQEIIDAFNAWKAQFTYSGGCNVSTSDISVYSVPNSCGGTVTVVYTATDECGQSVTGEADFTLNPEILTVSCPVDEVQPACQSQAAINAAFGIWKAKFTFTGGCGTVATDLSAIAPPNACGGTVVVNYTATDACGQVNNCSAIFTIDAPSNVLQEPSFTVPADITVYRDANCNYNADPLTVTGIPTDLEDNCTDAGNLTMNYIDAFAAGSCANELIITRTWTVSDNCSNTTSKDQIITVTDTISPVIVCAPDVNGVADNDECNATGVDLGTTTATDNCQVASIVGVRSDGLPLTDPFPVGVTTITWTATDGCGNTSTCIQTVNMIDGINQPPVITCPDNVVQPASANNCYLENVTIDNPVATDNCEVATISWVMTGATTGASPLTGFNYVGGETFNVGVTTVTYMATDSAGNFATCAFTVTVEDVVDPVIDINSCQDVTDSALPGTCVRVPGVLNDPVYSDTCWPNSALTLSWTMTGATTGSGLGSVADSAFNVGVTTVTYTVADPDGNEDQCSFTVTILDATAPVIDIASCANVSETADPDNCSKISATIGNPVYSDNCYDNSELTLAYTITGATTGSGNGTVNNLTFNVGVSTVTYTVTDPDNNSASCSFTVTIIDVTDPEVDMTNCVDVSDVADPGNCSKVSAKLIDPVYSDTCWDLADLILSWTMTGATTGSGFGTVTDSAFNVGVTTVTYTVTDPDGNTDNCTFTVTIVDVTDPSVGIQGCEDVTDVTTANNCNVVPGEIKDPVYSDTCWDITDLTISWTMTGATSGSGTGSVKGQSFNAGITTVTYTVTDPDGNEATCDFTVTIIPFNPPQFQAGCPDDVTGTTDDGVCGANLTIPDPDIDDPCNVGYTITNDFNGTDNASGIYPVGTTQVIWTITPTVGTPVTCTQTVTVTDDEAPVITKCPETRNFNDCSSAALTGPAYSETVASSTYAEFSDATNGGVATDNCAIVAVTYVDVASGTECPITITRTWTVYDAAGLSASCDQIINIGETTPPVVGCTDDVTIPSEFNETYADYSIPVFSYSDNCTPTNEIEIEWVMTGVTTDSGTGIIPTPYRFNQGLTTVTYTFTDNCGNETICDFTIFVMFPPDIDCIPPKNYTTDAGVCTHELPTDVNNPGVPGNTTGENITWKYTIFNPDGSTGATGTSNGITPQPIASYDFWLGVSTIEWVGINSSGTDTCRQLITVEDKEPPTFTSAPISNCVDQIESAIYTVGSPQPFNRENLIIYSNPDVFTFEAGNTTLDITNLKDNCCAPDELIINWTISFADTPDPDGPAGTMMSNGSITGTGQPSTYGSDMFFPGDGVNFETVTHTITYTVTDCNGNISLTHTENIEVTPRPQLIKAP